MTQMNEQTDRALIFANWPDGRECFFPYHENKTLNVAGEPTLLAERIEFVSKYLGGFTPVAWAPNGTKTSFRTREESIAAGRVIKLIDGKYIPFGEGAPLYCDAQGEPIAPTFHCAAETLNPPDPVADECAEPEKVRPALTWNTPARIDRFPADWKYDKSTATPDHAYSHYLTRVADAGVQVAPGNGSVWVLGR